MFVHVIRDSILFADEILIQFSEMCKVIHRRQNLRKLQTGALMITESAKLWNNKVAGKTYNKNINTAKITELNE